MEDMLSDRYESKRDFGWDWYTILKSDWIDNLDHMHISGIKHSSVKQS